MLTLVGQTVQWMQEQGAEGEAMRTLVAQTLIAAGRLAAERSEPIGVLMHRLATPGGITERGLNALEAGGQSMLWRQACEAVLDRLTRAPKS